MKKLKSERAKERNLIIYETLKDIPIGSDRAIAVQSFVKKYDLTIAMVYRIFNKMKSHHKEIKP
jgi:Mor family transcriptional regulator